MKRLNHFIIVYNKVLLEETIFKIFFCSNKQKGRQKTFVMRVFLLRVVVGLFYFKEKQFTHISWFWLFPSIF
jgi:hypothetical protein